ncbi:hypothetical protein CAL26_09825 [Bordetella genomosp. 9]|uniref:Uncharacterized protein n=1 Tax=Bordetella genomosp. 9 TaxID=1416803 RepID=A0A261RGG5_9BORD|nr:hypothetical protein [Bordetella genomosp. 9]OZI23720.1 hypothetical protein CAL26_09825 [Bordetella genomosp. 9]
MLVTKEHYDLMVQFERGLLGRFDKEAKELWPRGIIYQDGHINELFLAYRRGYAFAVADYRVDLQNLEASRDGYRDDARVLHAALTRMVARYEPDFDLDDIRKWRPGWLRDALIRTNALDDAAMTGGNGNGN